MPWVTSSVDTLLALRPSAAKLHVPKQLGVASGDYAVATFHRAGSVDDAATLAALLAGMSHVRPPKHANLSLVHPRTRKRITDFGLGSTPRGSDSSIRWATSRPSAWWRRCAGAHRLRWIAGGDHYLGVPCLTARPNTEWTETVESGTNRLVAPSLEAIKSAFAEARQQARNIGAPPRPPLWDGHAAERIVALLA